MPKIGWFCAYTPLEILLGAGYTPVRIFGHGGSIRGAYGLMHTNICPHVLSCLDRTMEGAFDRLEGYVIVNSCDAMRRLFDVLRTFMKPRFIHLIDLPKSRTEADVSYVRREFRKLASAIESHTGAEISEDAIREAAAAYGEARDVYGRLNALRKEAPPRVTGSEIARMAWRFFSIPPAAWCMEAEAFLAEKKAEGPRRSEKARPRVLFAGSLIHSPEVVALIEDCGLDVVYDDQCAGARLFEAPVHQTGDLLVDMARACLGRPPCARMAMIEERAKRTLAKAAEHRAAGVILHAIKFCDAQLSDAPKLRAAFGEAGLRTLVIESDCTLGSIGQLRTRIEAFAEMLGGA